MDEKDLRMSVRIHVSGPHLDGWIGLLRSGGKDETGRLHCQLHRMLPAFSGGCAFAQPKKSLFVQTAFLSPGEPDGWPQ